MTSNITEPMSQNPLLLSFAALYESHVIYDTKLTLCKDWDFAVTLFPTTMAPNLITLTGLGFILVKSVFCP